MPLHSISQKRNQRCVSSGSVISGAQKNLKFDLRQMQVSQKKMSFACELQTQSHQRHNHKCGRQVLSENINAEYVQKWEISSRQISKTINSSQLLWEGFLTAHLNFIQLWSWIYIPL